MKYNCINNLILWSFQRFSRKYYKATIKDIQHFQWLYSFLQKFCAEQSPTSYVVEVQSKAENDWLITLSKKGPSPINPPHTHTHIFLWNLSVLVYSAKRQKTMKKENLSYNRRENNKKSVVLKSLQTPPLHRNSSVVQGSWCR